MKNNFAQPCCIGYDEPYSESTEFGQQRFYWQNNDADTDTLSKTVEHLLIIGSILGVGLCQIIISTLP